MEAGINIVVISLFDDSQNTYMEAIKNVRQAANNFSNRLGLVFSPALALAIKGFEIRSGLLEVCMKFWQKDTLGPEEELLGIIRAELQNLS